MKSKIYFFLQWILHSGKIFLGMGLRRSCHKTLERCVSNAVFITPPLGLPVEASVMFNGVKTRMESNLGGICVVSDLSTVPGDKISHGLCQ